MPGTTTPARRTRLRRILRRALLWATAALLALAAVLVVNTLRLAPQPVSVTPAAAPPLDADAAAARLGQALRFPTISYPDGAQIDSTTFRGLHAFLETAFPAVHARLQREVISGLSLFYTWPGRDASLAPVVLTGHLDVVPVEAGSAQGWTHPPFSGEVRDGYVWGRGALDDKSGVVGILEAAELLVQEGFVPERTIYLAFGHDEESSGRRGAGVMAARLAERGIRPALVLDEGGAITQGVVPGVAEPVALVGIAEKGYLSLELSTEAAGGHSSAPPDETAIGVLSRAVARLEAHPFPARLDGATAALFERLAPHLPFGQRMAFANRWLLDPLLRRALLASPATAAALRTTTAPTMLAAGLKENVLPERASAVVNFRILPGETVESVETRVRETIADARVRLRRLDGHTDPSPVSRTDADAFRLVERSIREAYRGDAVIVAPYLVTAATDARYYAPLSEHVYRFNGYTLGPADLRTIHGAGERISVESYTQAVAIYYRLLRNTNAL